MNADKPPKGAHTRTHRMSWSQRFMKKKEENGGGGWRREEKGDEKRGGGETVDKGEDAAAW